MPTGRRRTARRLTVTTVFERHWNWYVGYVPGIPGVNAQERTLRAARESLRVALRELGDVNPKQLRGVRGATASMSSLTSSPPFRGSKRSPLSRCLTRPRALVRVLLD